MLVPVAYTDTCPLSFAAGLKNMFVTLSVSLTLLKYVGCLLPSGFNMDCTSKVPDISLSLKVSLVLEKYFVVFLLSFCCWL